MFNTPEFWVFISFILFVMLVFKPFSSKIDLTLKNYIQTIKSELDEIRGLRIQSKDVLTEYQKKHHETLLEAEKIIEQSRIEVDRLQKVSMSELKESLERQEKQALERIEAAKDRALSEVKEMAIDLAIAASAKILNDILKNEDSEKLIESQIKSLPSKLH